MEHALALQRIVVALGAMNIFLRLCGIDDILSTRNCVRGRERTLIQSCFPCKRLTQPWLSFNRAFFSPYLIKYALRTYECGIIHTVVRQVSADTKVSVQT